MFCSPLWGESRLSGDFGPLAPGLLARPLLAGLPARPLLAGLLARPGCTSGNTGAECERLYRGEGWRLVLRRAPPKGSDCFLLGVGLYNLDVTSSALLEVLNFDELFTGEDIVDLAAEEMLVFP